MITDDESRLVASAAKGDESAFEAIVVKYQSMVYRVCLSKLRSREEALDVSQEVFIKAYRALGSFRGESGLSSWLYRITLNAINDFVRAEKKRAHLSIDDDGEEGHEPEPVSEDGSTMPEEALVANERKRQLRAALSGLTDEHREVIILRDIEGYSYDEIARTLGLEVGTVKSRISRARNSLREILLEGNFIR